MTKAKLDLGLISQPAAYIGQPVPKELDLQMVILINDKSSNPQNTEHLFSREAVHLEHMKQAYFRYYAKSISYGCKSRYCGEVFRRQFVNQVDVTVSKSIPVVSMRHCWEIEVRELS